MKLLDGLIENLKISKETSISVKESIEEAELKSVEIDAARANY